MTVNPDLVRNASLSADSIAMGFQGTGAQKTKAIIERALESLEANGMITFVPPEDWDDYFIPDPPYIHPFAKAQA